MQRSSLAALLIALNVALGIIVIAWLHSPPFGYEAQRQQHRDLPAISATEPSDAVRGWSARLLTDPNATFAMLVAAFTLGLVWLGSLQLRDSRLLQRAYLNVEPFGIRQGSNSFFADIGIRNAGRLPARHVAWLIRVERFSMDNEWKDFSYAHLKSGGTHVIPAGGVMRRSEPTSIDGRFIQKALAGDGEYFVYVWGEVSYSDGFRNDRFVRFCHRYNYAAFKPRLKGYDIPTEEGRYHESGNDAD
jgi:hypothetical protein